MVPKLKCQVACTHHEAEFPEIGLEQKTLIELDWIEVGSPESFFRTEQNALPLWMFQLNYESPHFVNVRQCWIVPSIQSSSVLKDPKPTALNSNDIALPCTVHSVVRDTICVWTHYLFIKSNLDYAPDILLILTSMCPCAGSNSAPLLR